MSGNLENRNSREIADHREGFEWLLTRAIECGGSLREIIAIQPLGKASGGWVTGFNAAFWVLCEILVPKTVEEGELERFIAEHEPIPADDAAVRAFVLDGADPEAVREALWGN
jgi:hypothetical protein